MVKDSIHDQFDESVEAYMDGAKAKKRVNKKCKHCQRKFVFRNVGQLVCHLAAPDTGVGKASGCASVPPEVKKKCRRRLADAETARLRRRRWRARRRRRARQRRRARTARRPRRRLTVAARRSAPLRALGGAVRVRSASAAPPKRARELDCARLPRTFEF